MPKEIRKPRVSNKRLKEKKDEDETKKKKKDEEEAKKKEKEEARLSKKKLEKEKTEIGKSKLNKNEYEKQLDKFYTNLSDYRYNIAPTASYTAISKKISRSLSTKKTLEKYSDTEFNKRIDELIDDLYNLKQIRYKKEKEEPEQEFGDDDAINMISVLNKFEPSSKENIDTMYKIYMNRLDSFRDVGNLKLLNIDNIEEQVKSIFEKKYALYDATMREIERNRNRYIEKEDEEKEEIREQIAEIKEEIKGEQKMGVKDKSILKKLKKKQDELKLKLAEKKEMEIEEEKYVKSQNKKKGKQKNKRGALFKDIQEELVEEAEPFDDDYLDRTKTRSRKKMRYKKKDEPEPEQEEEEPQPEPEPEADIDKLKSMTDLIKNIPKTKENENIHQEFKKMISKMVLKGNLSLPSYLNINIPTDQLDNKNFKLNKKLVYKPIQRRTILMKLP